MSIFVLSVEIGVMAYRTELDRNRWPWLMLCDCARDQDMFWLDGESRRESRMLKGQANELQRACITI
jgi:hypothetical protein